MKWCGSKLRLLPELTARLPDDMKWRRHFEPFCGSAALFFARAPMRAVLADQNVRLINTFTAVRDDVEEVIAWLGDLASEHCQRLYYETRELFNEGVCAGPAAAAMFIYLNRTCFNGLYRENKLGNFNVPMGSYADPKILDADSLRAASKTLEHTMLLAQPFEDTLALASENDFVYLDPPYEPVNATSNFTAYQKSGFSQKDQERLRDAFDALHELGCRVMLSNSDTPYTRALYRHWNIERVSVRRSVSCGPRGLASEIIVRNYT